MMRGRFHCEGGQTLEQVTRGVVGFPPQDVLRTPLDTTNFLDQAGAWTIGPPESPSSISDSVI